MKLNIGLLICIVLNIHNLANGATTTKPTTMPLIIGHRGASGMYPEHTALAYRYTKLYRIEKYFKIN